MADPNSLYSYLGSEPTFLPHRIKLSNGLSRTDSTTFTDEELLDAGFTGPYAKPEKTDGIFDVFWDANDLEYKVITNEDNELNLLKNRVSQYLSFCEWTISEDSPLSLSLKSEWLSYRKKLTDMLDNLSINSSLIWPDSPSYA